MLRSLQASRLSGNIAGAKEPTLTAEHCWTSPAVDVGVMERTGVRCCMLGVALWLRQQNMVRVRLGDLTEQ